MHARKVSALKLLGVASEGPIFSMRGRLFFRPRQAKWLASAVVFESEVRNKSLPAGQTGGGAVTPDHYHSLRVAPCAEDAVVRAAYLALMRLYHPDANPDPRAQLRAREITGAFAVLGDPDKRARYDALRSNEATQGEAWFAADQQSPAPMRKVGLASVGLALVLSLGLVVQRESDPQHGPQEFRTLAANPEAARYAPLLDFLAGRTSFAPGSNAGRGVRSGSGVAPAVHSTSAHRPKSSESELTALVRPAAAQGSTSDRAAMQVPKQELAPAVVQKAAEPMPIAIDRRTDSASQSPAAANCRPDPSNVADGKCTDDRDAQIERIATGFLRQSMEHAGWYKQQLLLSAGNRSATARAFCRSDECVTDAYMRQIRDITAIMQGGTPSP